MAARETSQSACRVDFDAPPQRFLISASIRRKSFQIPQPVFRFHVYEQYLEFDVIHVHQHVATISCSHWHGQDSSVYCSLHNGSSIRALPRTMAELGSYKICFCPYQQANIARDVNTFNQAARSDVLYHFFILLKPGRASPRLQALLFLLVIKLVSQ